MPVPGRRQQRAGAVLRDLITRHINTTPSYIEYIVIVLVIVVVIVIVIEIVIVIGTQRGV